jgi:hypothetical protein
VRALYQLENKGVENPSVLLSGPLSVMAPAFVNGDNAVDFPV